MNVIRRVFTNQNKFSQNLLQNNFGSMRTSQQTIIYGKKPDNQQYDRQYFQLRSENPNYEKELREKQIKKDQEKIIQKFQTHKFNDKNESNHLQVQVNSPFVGKTAKIRKKRQFNLQQLALENKENSENTVQTYHPFIQIIKPREPKITVTGIRRNIPSTLKKLRNCMKIINRKQIFDAMTIVNNVGTKASRYVLQALKQVMRHAKGKDMDLNRLYVQSAMMGKQRRFKLLYYKAKSQMGVVRKDICQVRITLEEKPIKELYKEVLVGKTPPTLAFMLRENLKNQQADYETLRKWSFILTAKGRQQKKLMFKRKVIQLQQEYLRHGVKIEKKVIATKILEVEASQWADEYEQKRLEIDQAQLNQRMAIYKKNEQISGF